MKSSKGDKELYEGFDRIYHVVPSFSWHQFVLFCLVSSCTILSGMVSSNKVHGGRGHEYKIILRFKRDQFS